MVEISEFRAKIITQGGIKAQVERSLTALRTSARPLKRDKRLPRPRHAVDDRAALSVKEIQHTHLFPDQLLVHDFVEIGLCALRRAETGDLRGQNVLENPVVVGIVQTGLQSMRQFRGKKPVDGHLHARWIKIVH